LEPTPEEYVVKLVEVFREVRRVLREDGVLWLNLGDSYNGSGKKEAQINSPKQMTSRGANTQRGTRVAGLKPKDLIGIPWQVAFALQADGWWLRSDIIWAKPNPMPESVRDRPTKSHEYLFLLTKSQRYYYDADAIKEPFTTSPNENYPARSKILGRGEQGASIARGNDRDKSGGFPPRNMAGRNKRTVWTIPTRAYKEAHFATFPEKLVEPCIIAGSREGDVVLDPFAGSGTVGVVCARYGRRFIGIELNPEYAAMAERRIKQVVPLFNH